MGPVSRYLGKEVPSEVLVWQDPVPAVNHDLVNDNDIAELKSRVLASGLSTERLVHTAWSSAASYRHSDKRGGANGARIGLNPMKDWAVNDPAELTRSLEVLTAIQTEFNNAGGSKISLADLIVLAGGAAVEDAAQKAGHNITVPFRAGRTDASQDQTDVLSVSYLEPKADGFRNFLKPGADRVAEELLLDRAQLLNLSAPEMTVLIGGMRALNANTGGTKHGVLTDRPGTLSNDFFVNLLDMGTVWEPTSEAKDAFNGRDRASGNIKWQATRVDLIFGSNSQLRALSEAYASGDAEGKFVNDFVAAWSKVMENDRYDLK